MLKIKDFISAEMGSGHQTVYFFNLNLWGNSLNCSFNLMREIVCRFYSPKVIKIPEIEFIGFVIFKTFKRATSFS